MMACITLLTDFGIQDEYVGVLKGVILTENPDAVVVDITHGIEPQNIIQGAFTLKSAFGFFPRGSIHLAIVDPGVGTDRAILAVLQEGHIFLAPDNGLLWPIVTESAPQAIHRVDNTGLHRQPVSPTFHGRDIFAPVAAYLSAGGKLQDLGPALPLGHVKPLEPGAPRILDDNRIEGQVVTVDRFGNLITNIQRAHLDRIKPGDYAVHVGGHRIARWADTYARATSGRPMALIGSRDCLEIAVNGGSAADALDVAQGAAVLVCVA